MDAADDVRLRQRQQVVVALLVADVGVKAFAVVVTTLQAMSLDHGAHGPVQNQDALIEQAVKQGSALIGHAMSANKKTRPLWRDGFVAL